MLSGNSVRLMTDPPPAGEKRSTTRPAKTVVPGKTSAERHSPSFSAQ